MAVRGISSSRFGAAGTAGPSASTDAVRAKSARPKKPKKPVCLLCRRKFASFKHLAKHEAESAMHRENLAKRQHHHPRPLPPRGAAGGADTTENGQYRDRAGERRGLHGQNAGLKFIGGVDGSKRARTARARKAYMNDKRERRMQADGQQAAVAAGTLAPPVPTHGGAVNAPGARRGAKTPPAVPALAPESSALDADTNKGAKLMKLMGWKAGEGLGKAKQGRVAPVDHLSIGGRLAPGAALRAFPRPPSAADGGVHDAHNPAQANPTQPNSIN